MTLFDIVIGILGVMLIVKGIIGTKKQEVDSMIVPVEEMMRCMDKKGFAAYIMPKCVYFGIYCVVFSIEAICFDLKFIEIPRPINSIFIFTFIIAWSLFTYYLKKGKSKYIQ